MKIELLDENCLPKYAHEGDAAMDVRASKDCEWEWESGVQVCYVPLGFRIETKNGCMLNLYSRSGHGWKHNITLANSVGVIDPSFRGEVHAKLIRVGVSMMEPPEIKQYDRVAQMVLTKLESIELDIVDNLDSTDRGANGFGSSGVK